MTTAWRAGSHGHDATRLESRAHCYGFLERHAESVTAVNRAGVHVDDTIFEPPACADSVLRSDERELGVCLVDLGAGSCDLIVFQQGAVAHTAVIPSAATTSPATFRSACARGWRTRRHSENFGNAVPTLIPEGNEVEVPSVGDRPSRMMPQRLAGEILGPRARELFELLRDNLRHAGVLEHCVAGFVFSGGASRLPGILDVAESVLRKASRLAWPTPMAKMPSFLSNRNSRPCWAWRITVTAPGCARLAGARFWFAHESAVREKGRVRISVETRLAASPGAGGAGQAPSLQPIYEVKYGRQRTPHLLQRRSAQRR